MVHGENNYNSAKEASLILFKKGEEAVEALKGLSSDLFNDIFEGVPQKTISLSELEKGIHIIDALVTYSGFLKSNGEARRALKENSISVNKQKVDANSSINKNNLIAGDYILLQRGKKNYFIITVN